MSLDFFIVVPDEVYPTRENGRTVSYPAPGCGFHRQHVGNITHNMNVMAQNVPVSVGLTLYDVLWHPDEHGLKTTDDIVDYIAAGVLYMAKHAADLEQYNPSNGWGDYGLLLGFTRRVGSACLFNPGCKIEVSC